MNAIDNKTRDTAMLISSILFRATVLGFVLLGISAIPMFGMTDAIYAVHSSIIEIPRPEYNALIFTWFGNMKILVLVICLLPAIAIRWALKAA